MKFYKRKGPKSERSKLIKKIDDLLLKIIILERGRKCQICGESPSNLGKFHILSKGAHPRLRFNKDNILLTCWYPCHYYHHHDSDNKYAKRTKRKIIELKGRNYKIDLQLVERFHQRHTLFYLYSLYEVLKSEYLVLIGG